MSFLNKKLLSFEPKIFGLDLSDLSIKIMQLEKEGSMEKIRSYAALDIPAGNIEDGKILNKEEVASFIREAIRLAGPKKINTKKVICSIPESKAFLRIITVPKMEKSEVEEAIKWEMEANIPMPIEQVYFDWQMLPWEEKNKQSILTVAVSKDVVDESIEVLEKAGLEVYGLEVESVATARSLIEEQCKSKEACSNTASLIVDMGSQRSSFIMVIKGAPCFTSSTSFSSDSISKEIARKLNLNKSEAEEAKVNHGIENTSNDNPIFSAIQYLLENLVREIDSTLDFYEEISKEKAKIEKIILCGGGGNLRGLIPYLATKLKKEVELGDPWINFKLGNNLPIISKKDSVRYATVVGLAQRGLYYYD
jgi:type IV pilus assembly protein PilM